MGRRVSLPIRAVTLTASDSDFDIIQFGSSSGRRCIVHALSLTTDQSTAQYLDVALIIRSGAGSGGSAITEAAIDQGDSATPATTANYNVTTPGSVTRTLFPYYWNITQELLLIPTPEMRAVISESSFFALHCGTSITGTVKANGYFIVEEW